MRQMQQLKSKPMYILDVSLNILSILNFLNLRQHYPVQPITTLLQSSDPLFVWQLKTTFLLKVGNFIVSFAKCLLIRRQLLDKLQAHGTWNPIPLSLTDLLVRRKIDLTLYIVAIVFSTSYFVNKMDTKTSPINRIHKLQQFMITDHKGDNFMSMDIKIFLF